MRPDGALSRGLRAQRKCPALCLRNYLRTVARSPQRPCRLATRHSRGRLCHSSEIVSYCRDQRRRATTGKVAVRTDARTGPVGYWASIAQQTRLVKSDLPGRIYLLSAGLRGVFQAGPPIHALGWVCQESLARRKTVSFRARSPRRPSRGIPLWPLLSSVGWVHSTHRRFTRRPPDARCVRSTHPTPVQCRVGAQHPPPCHGASPRRPVRAEHAPYACPV